MPQFPIHDSKYFDIREFVHPDTWANCPNPEQQVDRRIVRCSDLLREKIDLPVIVNNWHYWKPGRNKYVSSGHRSKADKTGAVYSQHRGGRASDNKVFGCPVSALSETARALLDKLVQEGLTTHKEFEKRGYTSSMLWRVVQIYLPEFIAAGLTTVEDPAATVDKRQDWLHMDCRERRTGDDPNQIRIVKP